MSNFDRAVKALEDGEAHYAKQLPKHIYVKNLRPGKGAKPKRNKDDKE